MTEEAEQAKQRLLSEIAYTNRGGTASTNQQGAVEDAQLGVEAFGTRLDYAKLAGTWRLLYTTAPDVLGLVAKPPEGLPVPLRVGDIYQRFSTPEEGIVENIIKLSVPFLLDESEGVTATVRADYRVTSPHRIELTFREASLSDVNISAGLQNLLAPAVLPRTLVQMRLLQEVKNLRFTVPLRTPSTLLGAVHRETGSTGRAPRGGQYLLTYLDDDMLIGRSVLGRGTFIFERAA